MKFNYGKIFLGAGQRQRAADDGGYDRPAFDWHLYRDLLNLLYPGGDPRPEQQRLDRAAVRRQL